MGKQQTNAQRRNWLWEFSKKIVFTVTVIFIAVYFYACFLLWKNPDSVGVQSLIENISRIFEITVVSYAVKAGFENVSKIKKNNKEDEI